MLFSDLRLSRLLRVAAGMVLVIGLSDGYLGAATLASGALQRCLGIVPNTGRMNRGPATQAYCEQLPAASLYNEAGERFKRGDHQGAAALVTKAARAGNPIAQLRLGMLYENGDGVPRSYKSAIYWLTQAANAGEPGSQAELAAYYEEGDILPENWDTAARLYQASAVQGWHLGQSGYARCFQFGIGVPQNRTQAIAWFQLAAAQGNAKGAYYAKWLSDRTNNIGFRSQMEHDIVITPLRFAGNLYGGDPAGITFHNSTQRIIFLRGQRAQADKIEADVFRSIRQREHDDCVRAGRDGCI
jgi:TPR repeat protein